MDILSTLFENAKVMGVPLLLIVLGLVQYIKGFGLNGVVVKIISLFTGVVLGLGYQISVKMPSDFPSWFSAVIFGLILGLVASGIFEVINPPSK